MAGNTSFTGIKRLSSAHAREYTIVDKYNRGYENRRDVTNLPPGVLIVGSQNVLTNVSERVQIRQGYALDGPTSTVLGPVLAAYDWITRNNTESHVRAGGLTTAGNDGKLQYRYVAADGTVTWRDLITGQSSVAYNFTTFFDTTEFLRVLLFVNGANQIQEWNGAVTTLSGTTVNTITKTGATWLSAGFYSTANKSLIINGNTYTYTGGENTNTLTGVMPDPTGEANGSIVHQKVVTTLNTAMTNGPGALYLNGLISVLNNQIFLGSLVSSSFFISKRDNYKDYTFSNPRQSGEGFFGTIDANLVAFKPQEQFMYIAAGDDLWYNVNFQIQTSTVGVTYEQVNALALKTGKQQGAQSQATVSHMKNNIILVTNEPTVDTFGRIESSLATPQTVNLSDPIKIDMDQYDFTDASIFYFKYFIYVCVPADGVVLPYNLETKSWEAPQTLPISRMYIVDGELYGHSYATFESYKLFTGFADRVYPGAPGAPIDAKWVFSYEQFGSRFAYKSANSFYIEGYINPNTVMTARLTYELDGCKTVKTFTVDGSDSQIVCLLDSSGSLGKESLGKQKLGGGLTQSINGLPPKFRVEKTFNNTPFFECSTSFEVLGVDNRMELLAFGLNQSPSTEEPNQIRQ